MARRYVWQSEAWPNLSGGISGSASRELNNAWRDLSAQLDRMDEAGRNAHLLERAGQEIASSQAIENISVTPALCSYCLRANLKDGMFRRDTYSHMAACSMTEADPDNPQPLIDLMADMQDALKPAKGGMRDKLAKWHTHLMQFGHNNEGVKGGEYRRVTVGVFGAGKCIYEAVPVAHVGIEMSQLLDDIREWKNQNQRSPAEIIQAAGLFHLKFVMIHPYADGNGRSGRLIDLHCQATLPYFAHEWGIPFSMAKAIWDDRTGYYLTLQKVQGFRLGDTIDVSPFLEWHAKKAGHAMQEAKNLASSR